ncbi:serine--tRNA ligase [Candidatus Micrarchaeota archaeon CG1_02_55_22]|nr:MAG: serine--tRNA ligase [Candidatus Micrarchaeota archaeon CG1_02_55_22]
MLDLKFIRGNIDTVKTNLAKRQDPEKSAWLDELVKLDEEHRKLNAEIEALRARRNTASHEVAQAIKDKLAPEKIAALKEEAADVPAKIKEAEETAAGQQETMRYYLMRLPNLLHESVPYGADEKGNVVIRKHGEPTEKNFELVPHGELCQKNGWTDFERAAKVSGQGFVYIKGQLAILEQSLIRMAVDLLSERGYTLVNTPMMLRRDAYEGVTSLSDFEDVIYKLDGKDEYMIATSEHPLAAMYKDEVVDAKELPLKYAGLSACFRKEIGGHGVDSKGLFRMHQFNKVEQFVFCRPEESWKYFDEILANSEAFWQALGIPYQILEICTGDIGIVAAKKQDVEAWFPRNKEYREVGSCSNCTAYQATRLNAKYRVGKQGADDAEKAFLHTLNNTLMATSRAMVAILENYQNEDGTVTVPPALRRYTGFDVMTPEKP